jgi:hypothetical protein
VTKRPKIGRPPFVPTDSQRQLVQVLVANGISQKVMAANIVCDLKTLRRHFKEELKEGHDRVEAAMGAAIVRAGLAGNVFAAKYWLSTHGGVQWRVVEGRQIGGLEGAPPISIEAATKVTIYLPDNGRDKPAETDETAPSEDTTDDGDPAA